MKIPLVDLQAQYKKIAGEINEKISHVIQKGDFILGEELELFEKEFANYCGTNYAVGVGSGNDALILSLLACGIKPQDEVITAVNTFAATVEAISFTGAKPVLVDIDPASFNIDLNLLEKAITQKTKAIIPVHLYGQPVNMDKVKEIADRHNLFIIEDACQAHGAEYNNKKAGSFGLASAFSFYPGKNLGAYGDGGMVTTNDKDVEEKVRMLRNHGQKQKYSHELKGFTSRLDTIQAGILRIKLKYLDDWNKSRNLLAKMYDELLKGTSLKTPEVGPLTSHVFHLYVVRSKKRDELLNFLKEKEIYAGIHYPVPIHLLPAFKDLGYKEGDFPVAEQAAKEILSLPIYPELTERSVSFVVDAIKEFEGVNKPTF